jgi:uncharacterized membrane protein
VKTLPIIVVSIVLFGISVFFRKLSVDRISPYQLQVISGFVYASMAPMWYYMCRKNGISGYDTTGVVFAIVCILTGTFAAVLFGFALKQSDNPGVISALISLNPVITMALSVFFLHESLSLTKMLAFILAVVSAILVNL